jgi:hypothetical protein
MGTLTLCDLYGQGGISVLPFMWRSFLEPNPEELQEGGPLVLCEACISESMQEVSDDQALQPQINR